MARPLASLACLACSGGLVLGYAPAARGQEQRCPAAEHLPQLTIDTIRDPPVPVIDTWQIYWNSIPLSDHQLAMLAGNDTLIDATRAEMESRGTWVYIGLLGAAAGTAVSSTGWVLYGQDSKTVPSSVSLPLALGGILLGIAGVMGISEAIQTPLEPHLAPTPRHRLTREQARALVSQVNDKLYRNICAAAEKAAASGEAPVPSAPQPTPGTGR